MARRLAIAVLLVCGHAAAARAANYIQTENAKPGTTEWQLTSAGGAAGSIEGYASLTSVNRGGRIKFFVNTSEPSYSIDIFRMGYYGGLGGRRVLNTITRSGIRQLMPVPDAVTGLIECNWIDPYVLDIPNTSDPTNWMSGIYLAKLTASVSRKQQYIVFTVRDDSRATDLLLAQTVDTYQAYNVWGGKSLYGTLANRTDTANAARKVSFNRPYYGEESNGGAEFFYWEFPMLRWLEREGYDISYATNVDVDADPRLLFSHKGFLSVGHDEYWSWRMRDNVEAARDAGVNLGFFSGNASYWQVRFEPSVFTGDLNRTMVGYKDYWSLDPILPANYKTNEFRLAPVNRSEDRMIGVMFVTQARPALVIEDASHWVLTGTGLKNGDRVVNPDGTTFLGYEVDAMGPASPAATQRIGHSPAEPDAENYSDMTVYRAASGATVFAAGSIGWSVTIPAIQQITRNVLARFVSGAFADTTPVRPPLPSPFLAQDIGNVGRAGFVGAAGAQSLTLNGAGHSLAGSADALYYVYQRLTGDGTIIAKHTGLQLFWDNRAGLMIRESLAPDSKYVAIAGRPSGSRGSLLEGVELFSRSVAGGSATLLTQRDSPLPTWLKLTRTQDVFSAFLSSDGTNWTSIGSATVPMGANAYIGISVASARPGVWVTANFDNISVIPGPPIAPPPPATSCASLTLSRTSFYSGALESFWPVTVTAPTTTCTWTAVSESPWLIVTTTPANPVGSGLMSVRALTNTTTQFRTGSFTVGATRYVVSQEQSTAPPAPQTCSALTLSMTSFYSGALQSDWAVAVTAPSSSCAWSAVSDSPWLIVTTDTPAGNGIMRVRVLTNTTGVFRTARLTVGGVIYTVKQEP